MLLCLLFFVQFKFCVRKVKQTLIGGTTTCINFVLSREQVSMRGTEREVHYSSGDISFFRLSKKHISTVQNITWKGDAVEVGRHFIWFRMEEEAGLSKSGCFTEVTRKSLWRSPSAQLDAWRRVISGRLLGLFLFMASFLRATLFFYFSPYHSLLPWLSCCASAFDLQRSLRMRTQEQQQDSILSGTAWMPAHRAPFPSDGQLQTWQCLWSTARPGFCLIKPYLIVKG